MKKKAEPEISKEENEDEYGYRTNEPRIPDIALKILAVVIAFIIWYYAMATDSTTFTRTFVAVPVDIINETGFSVISGYDNTVDITVQGKKSEINKLTNEDIAAYADLGSVDTAGRHTVSINVSMPGNVSLTGKSADSISVYMDNTVTKTVPVTVVVVNYMIDNGYELGSPTPNIGEIKVEGPDGVLDKIVSAQVSLKLGHITNSVTVTDTLTPVDAEGNNVTNPYIRMLTTEVEVTVPVYITRNVPLQVGFKYGYFNDETVKITISPRSLLVRGDPKTINSFNQIIITTLDEKKIVTDNISEAIVLPEGVINVYGYETATIGIEHIGTDTKEIVIEKFNVINPENLSYELLDEFITVKVRGPSSSLPYISDVSVRASVDLSGYSNVSGTSSVAVNIEITGLYKTWVYEVGEYKTSVRIN
ncbi:MAG: CdaR family protein [Eubacteriales bacterium]|nr:CdaR family protein [Eubacteriales bacterium]